jgi:hypothetical protein
MPFTARPVSQRLLNLDEYVGKPLVQFFSQLSEVWSQKGLSFTKGRFLAIANRELSDALVHGQGHV